MFKTSKDLIRVAVIEGWHPFDVVGFRDLFAAIPGIDPYHQTIENWAIDAGKVRKDYDVLLFYNMNAKQEPECAFCKPALEQAVLELGEKEGQGIFVLHHAILAYMDDTNWADMVGIPDRTFGFHMDQNVKVDIANPDHPITRGLSGYEILDETYTMASPGEGSEILMTTEHDPSMKVLAWTRRHRNARVFCYQLGHDAKAWENPHFREVLERGIRWAAGRI